MTTVDPADRKFLPGGSQNPQQRSAGGFPDRRDPAPSGVAGPDLPRPPRLPRRVQSNRPPAFDTEAMLTGSSMVQNPELRRQRERARPRVMAALAFHLGGHVQGMGQAFEQAAAPLADRFLDVAMEEPALVRRLEESVDALWALSDEEIARRVANGEDLTGFDSVLDSLSEVFWSVGADSMFTATVGQSQDAAKGTYEQLTADEAVAVMDALQAAGVEIPEGDVAAVEAVEAVDEGGVKVNTGETVSALNARTGSLGDLLQRPGRWVFDGQDLALTVDYDDGPVTYATRVPEGTRVDSTVDVLAAVVEAEHDERLVTDRPPPEAQVGAAGPIVEGMLGVAHKVGRFVDGTPGEGNPLSGLWESMTAALTGGDPTEFPFATPEVAEAQQQMRAEAVKQASVLPFPEEMMVAHIAEALMGEAGDIRSEEALSLAAEMVDEERSNLEDEWRRLTTDELIEQAEAAGEDLSEIGLRVDETMGKLLTGMEAWDSIAQRIGVNTVDFVWDATRGAWSIAHGDAEEGRRLFQSAWEAPAEADVAEYWGLEGDSADAALLGAGIIFDPATYLFGGSKGAAKLFRKALTEPRFAPAAMRLGPMRQITRSIAEKTGSQSTRSVLSLSGISDRGYVELMDLARNPQATKQQVEEALLRELPSTDGVGFFLAEGPQRAFRRSTAQGVGRTLENLHLVPAERHPELFRSLTRLDHSRSMNLGESTFLDDFFDMAVTARPDDADFLTEWAERAIDAVASLRGHTTARQGVLAARKQRARDLLNNMAGARANVVADPVGIRHNMREIRHTVATGELDDATRTQLNGMHDDMSRRLARTESQTGPLKDRSRELHREMGAATRLEGELATPESRASLNEVVAEFYDDWAQRINGAAGEDLIPVKSGAQPNPLAPGVPVRDWSAVTGGGRFGQPDDPTLAMALAGDDAQTASRLSTVGMFNRTTTARLPASAYEMVIFEKMATKPTLLQQWRKFTQTESVRRGIGAVKTAFAANLLLNPATIGRVHLDETLRFLADTGNVGGFLKSNVVAIPGTGRMVQNPWAMQHGRAMATLDEVQPWDWVERPTLRHATGVDDFTVGDYRRQVERWLNGTLLNDDLFGQYARSIRSGRVTFVDDATFPGGRRPVAPDEWKAWWDDGAGTGRPGKANARGDNLTWKTDKGTPISESVLDADEAFAAIHHAFETWLENMVDPKPASRLKDQLLKAATGVRGPLEITGPDARLLNAVKRVPGHPKDNFASVGGMFNTFFGQPSARRAGVFFEHYFDEAMSIYRPAYESKNRLLTEEMLIERAGVSADEASWMIRQGSDNSFVRWLMDGSGAVTTKALEGQAARYASRRSEDLMYQLTASSIAGSVPESLLLFPYARAALDFVSWWGNHLTRPMRFRLGPRAREAMAKHPILSKPIEVAESMPLNVRAMAKFAHLSATISNDHESFLDQAVDDLTFLPTRWSREIMLGMGPSPGPLPSWLVDGLAAEDRIPDETMEFLETVFPALGFTDENDDFLDRLFPVGRTSLRDLTMGSMRAMSAYFRGEDITESQGLWGEVHNILAAGRQPLFTQDFQAELYGEWLSDNAFTAVPGSDEWLLEASETAVMAGVEANKADWSVRLRNRIPTMHPETSEFRALGNYAGLFDDDTFNLLTQVGAFDANDLIEDEATGEPRIRAVFERMEAGEATVEERRWLADTLASVYNGKMTDEMLPGMSVRDWVHLSHPEMAVNLISKTEASDIPVRTDDHRDFKARYVDPNSGRLQNVPPGPEGLDVIREARRRGWIVDRAPDGPDGWMRDAHEAVLRSADNAVRAVWQQVTGREWSQDSTFRRDSETGAVEPGVISSLRDSRFELAPGLAKVLKATGLSVEEGDRFTVQEFRETLDDHRGRFATRPPRFDSALGNNPMTAGLNRHDDEYGQGLVEAVSEVSRRLSDQDLRFDDLPEEVGGAIRDRVKTAVDLGYISERDYESWWQEIFGPLDYQPPEPPPPDELDFGISVNRQDIAEGAIQVIDGDTVSVMAEDGPLRVRLVGINAPEVSQEGYGEAVANLQAVVEAADEVVLGVFNPELFGATQLSGPEDKRMLAWLYVKTPGGDFVPLYDPSVFGADNPRGAGTGGNVVDLQAILEAG